ncbi:tetratricopeptide repeat protein [Pontibacter beigongshangensis]|uniref:tetratricopeptide repeat protein n=1 Tax=Pontibacter beigongshangensis TaxID=2574733 RepID=UPI00164F7900|nr:tetratricopeptide repeat protein [Pontibacter beigongshangensis]
MKKVLLTVLAAASLQVATAQNSAVNSAVLNHKNGLLDKAQTDIDKAIVHKKTSESPKAWFYRGVIYQDMISSPIYSKQVSDETPNLVLEAFNKVKQLEGNNGEYTKQLPERMELLYGQVLNQAVAFHNEQKWDDAIKKYEMASKISPTDTTALMYAAYAATGKEDYKTAIQYYDKLLGIGHKTEPVYKAKIQLMQATEAKEEDVMKALEEGLAANPNSVYLMQEELKYYLAAGRGDEATEKLEKAIAADPKNASLYAVLGNVQERKKDLENATKNYKKAVELDPNNFDAYYNLGVMEYNKASELINQAAKMDYATYQKKGKPLEAQAKKHFEAAAPYFEAAHKAQPDDINTMQNLFRVYTRLDRKADADRMSKMLGNE